MSIRFLPAALIAVIVALTAVGGAALAFSFGTADSEKTDDLLERAADDLGVDAQTLKNALSQAQTNLRTERQQELLAELVENEVITEEQANEASVWLSQMPAAVDGLTRPTVLLNLAAHKPGDVVVGGHGIHESSSFATPFISPPFGSDVIEKMAEILGIDPESLENALESARAGQMEDSRTQAINGLIDKLVEDGEITQTEGAEIKAWLDAMPEWLMDNGTLLRLFSHGFDGAHSPFSLKAAPFFREFGPDLDHSRIFPELEELRRGHEPFFFAPGDEFEFPGFKFGAPEGSNRYFYHGPEGEFDFEGEFPPEFEGIFEGLGSRFGDLDQLLERFKHHGQWETEPAHEPEEDAEQASA